MTQMRNVCVWRGNFQVAGVGNSPCPTAPAPLPLYWKEGPVSQGYDELIGDTLALVNAARGAYGKELLNELPDARRGDASDCLYYRALEGLGVTGVSGPTISFDNERTANYIAQLWGTERSGGAGVKAPESFQKVITAFDDGKLNQYAVGSGGLDDDEDA